MKSDSYRLDWNSYIYENTYDILKELVNRTTEVEREL